MSDRYLESAEPDGLRTTSIRKWALDKYQLVSLYARLFSNGMKNKWPTRVYIDLCAGAGFSKLEETQQIYMGTPLLAMGAHNSFSDYILCERDDDSLNALRERIGRLFPTAKVQYVGGDCNDKVNEIIAKIPSGPSVLSFCFGDPFDLSIKFSTVRSLASRRMDFLFLLALHTDANRNVANYTRIDNAKIDEFLGVREWRSEWREAEKTRTQFPKFLAESFSRQMETLGYLPVPFHKMRQIRRDDSCPLYHLALFSKHALAFNFWEAVLKYSMDQRSMFDD